MGKPDFRFEGDSDTTTLATAKEWLKARLSRVNAGRKVICPCCAQRVSLRPRYIRSPQAALLILLYRTFQVGHVICIHKFIDDLVMEDADKKLFKEKDWDLLVHWDLLGDLDEVESAQAKEAFRSHYPSFPDDLIMFYRLTQLGFDYTLGEKPIPKRLLLFRNKVVGTDPTDLVTISDAFKRGPFKMSALPGDVTQNGKVF